MLFNIFLKKDISICAWTICWKLNLQTFSFIKFCKKTNSESCTNHIFKVELQQFHEHTLTTILYSKLCSNHVLKIGLSDISIWQIPKQQLEFMHASHFDNQVLRNGACSYFKTIWLIFADELDLKRIFRSSSPTNLKVTISELAHDSYSERHFLWWLFPSSFEHVILALGHRLYSENRLLTDSVLTHFEARYSYLWMNQIVNVDLS